MNPMRPKPGDQPGNLAPDEEWLLGLYRAAQPDFQLDVQEMLKEGHGIAEILQYLKRNYSTPQIDSDQDEVTRLALFIVAVLMMRRDLSFTPDKTGDAAAHDLIGVVLNIRDAIYLALPEADMVVLARVASAKRR